jgi:hypothetical protein
VPARSIVGVSIPHGSGERLVEVIAAGAACYGRGKAFRFFLCTLRFLTASLRFGSCLRASPLKKLLHPIHPAPSARVVTAGVFLVDGFELLQQFLLARREIHRGFDHDVT